MPLKPLARFLAEPGGAQVHHRHDTGLELTSGTRRRPHQQASCCHLLCLPSQLFRRSRAETPEGSRPAFAWSDLTRGLNPYPPCYRAAFASPSSSTRRPFGPPYGGPTPKGGRRAYHVPRTYQGWFRLCLFAGGSDDDDRGLEIPLYLATYLLVQASQRLWLAGSHDVYQQFT